MCNCVNDMNEQLEAEQPDNNTEICFGWHAWIKKYSGDRAIIATKKRNKYSQIAQRTIFATYCPFCGEAYESEQIVTNL